MENWQNRVVVEEQELDRKLRNLLSFIERGAGDKFVALPLEEQLRLSKQSHIMQDYSDILDKRIKAFK